jgi:hypothetical protein
VRKSILEPGAMTVRLDGMRTVLKQEPDRPGALRLALKGASESELLEIWRKETR